MDFLILADAVQVAEGKLSMLGGGWSRIAVSNYPTLLRYGVAVGLGVQPDEVAATCDLKVSVLDPEGKAVSNDLKAEIAIKGVPRDQVDRHREHVIVGMNAVVNLLQPGMYRVRAMSGNQMREITFEAVLKQ